MRVLPIPAAVVLLSLASVSTSRAVYQEPQPTRERLSALPLMTEIVVALRSGESVSGELADVTENDFGLWVDPANDLSHQYPLAQKVMRHIDYEDVEQIVAPDLTHRPPPMSKWWGIGFTYGSTRFTTGGESHRTLGATFHIPLTDRLGVEPEVRYTDRPSECFGSLVEDGTLTGFPERYTWTESSVKSRHYELIVSAQLVYDLMKGRRAIPYISGGAGALFYHDETNTAPVRRTEAGSLVPAPGTAEVSRYERENRLFWTDFAFGVRIYTAYGISVVPEVRLSGGLGSGVHDYAASAVVKILYRF